MKHRILLAVVSLGLMMSACERADESTPETSAKETPPLGMQWQELTVPGGTPLRYLAINVGNVTPFTCWEYKLCQADVASRIRSYIATWQPDVLMLSEVYGHWQLDQAWSGGPILPAGYAGQCGVSTDVNGNVVGYADSDASHEHECIAWKTSRVKPVSGSGKTAPGVSGCNRDFTGFRMHLVLDNTHLLTAVAVHPDSGNTSCRTSEISNYWSQLATGKKTIIGGDWNTDVDTELQVPTSFKRNYSKGYRWSLSYTSNEYTAFYTTGNRRLDHTFSNFGSACTTCGSTYGTANLKDGVGLGGDVYSHPRADGTSGCDHRQLLTDMVVPNDTPVLSGSGAGGNSGTTCHATYTFWANAGSTHTISTCGSFSGDTYLKVSGACTCSNDDACGSGSSCTCTASTSGNVTVCASTYGSLSGSWNYTVSSASP